jgi:hypothetical protein
MKVAKDASSTRILDTEKERDRKLTVAANEKSNLIKTQKDLQASITAENDQARLTEAAAKKKAWKAQQNADIASAIIAGALATIKALASGFFPVNLVFAAATAIATGIQVAMITRQTTPTFAIGGKWRNAGRLTHERDISLLCHYCDQEIRLLISGSLVIAQVHTTFF